jgi:iron(III) transport system ATP-binding protein
MTSESGHVLSCIGVDKSFGPAVALDSFSLDLHDGVIMALLGPSGCGKTTALRVMAGFERPASGEVWVGGRRVFGERTWVAPEHRRIGMVFQDWALFPHLDVWHNIAFGLDAGNDLRVREVLDLVRLNGFEERMPHELSGGQQQRVALARALAPSPEVILLDEPFSNLDASLRSSVRAEVRAVLKEAKATAIFVTHDQEEALSMADEMAVMAAGRVLQVGPPHEVYGAPANRRVAELVGEANFFPARVENGRAVTPLGVVSAPGLKDGYVQVMVRPESVLVERDPVGDACVEDAEFYGHDQLIRARLSDGAMVDVRLLGPRPDLTIGASVRVQLAGPAHLFRAGDDDGVLFPYCGIESAAKPITPTV